MNRIVLVAAVVGAMLPAPPFRAAPMRPMSPVTIEGTIRKIAWQPEQMVKGLPGMSGSAGHDRTVRAHYLVTLADTIVTPAAGEGDGAPFKSGEPITIPLDHPRDDGYLKEGLRVKITDFRMAGDEGGVHTSFGKLEILEGAKGKRPATPQAGERTGTPGDLRTR